MTKFTPQLKSVTFICQTLGMGGAETVNLDLLRAIQQETEVSVHAYVNFQPFIQQLKKNNIPVQRVPIVIDIIGNWKGLLKAFFLWPFALLQYIFILWQSRQTDVIFMSGFIEKIFISPLAWLFQIPVVWIEFAPMESLKEKFLGVPFWIYKHVLRFPQNIIVPTAYTEKYFLNDFPKLAKKIVVLPCARYNFEYALPKREKLSAYPTIVCVSRMEKGKGQDVLVRAFAEVIKIVPNAELLLVGAGEFEVEVRTIAQQLNLTKQVQFLGCVTDSAEIMKTATVCVFPSLWALEGFGMVTIEAMALAKPIVAFEYGPTPEIVEHEQTALLAQAGDVHDLADQIIRIIKTPQLAEKIGENARKTYIKKYQFETLVFEYLKVFTEAVKSSHGQT